MLPTQRRANPWPILLIALAIAHVLLARYAWRNTPLQVDTGMWAYIAGRILDGQRLYADLWESKPPGIYYLFALIERLFGRGSDEGFFRLDTVVDLVLLALTYRITRRIASPSAAAGATCLASIVLCQRILADWGDNIEKFVALFELIAIAVVTSNSARWKNWCIAGLCCGLAALFKQTAIAGILILLLYAIFARNDDAHSPALGRPPNFASAFRRIALFLAGIAIVWLPTLIAMHRADMLRPFFDQVIAYDLLRVSSTDSESARVWSTDHWFIVLDQLALAAVLFLPALFAFTSLRKSNPLIILCALHLAAVTIGFALAPYGYGHYLLQAVPTAAILAAAAFEKLSDSAKRPQLAVAGALIIAGLFFQTDHFHFITDPAYPFRQSYDLRRQWLNSLCALIQSETKPTQKVMLWPPDDAVSYYTQRTTPLECSNADVIFKGKIARIRPPIPELVARLAANPPDIIIDYTGLKVATAPDGAPALQVESGVSLLDDPDENHPRLEGRLLAPLHRWVRANYGAQRRLGACTFYYHKKPWRDWKDFLTPVTM